MTTLTTRQTWMSLTEVILLQSTAPSSDTDNGGTLTGAVRILATNFAPGTTALAQGQDIDKTTYATAASLLGTTYGDGSSTTVTLPDLTGRTTIGAGQGQGLPNAVLGQDIGQETIPLTQANLPVAQGGQAVPVDDQQPGLALHYCIRIEGSYAGIDLNFDALSMGGINQFSGDFIPAGYMECNGQLLGIDSNNALYNMIGTTFGGDGVDTFALPDLRGRTIVGATSSLPVGAISGLADVTLTTAQMPVEMGGGGQPFNNDDPTLSLNYIINLTGTFPSGTGGVDSTMPLIGEIDAVAFSGIPRGWAQCAGQILPINQFQALFSLLGTQFGGNGQINFALPDLRGRVVVGTGGDFVVGAKGGTSTGTLTLDDIPPIIFDGTLSIDALYGANGNDILRGFDGNDTLVSWGGRDRLEGGLGDDRMKAGAGNDELLGGDGKDNLNGSAGRDRLDGGADKDRLMGGGGADHFVFSALATGNDVIADFDATQNDRLTFSAAAFGGGLTAGALLADDQLVLGAAATAAHGQFLYSVDTGQLRWDSDGTGSARAVNVAILLNLGLHPATLASASFEVIA